MMKTSCKLTNSICLCQLGSSLLTLLMAKCNQLIFVARYASRKSLVKIQQDMAHITEETPSWTATNIYRQAIRKHNAF